MRRCRPEITVIAVLAIVTASVFWCVLGADFVAWDDDVEVYANPHLTGVTPDALRWMFFGTGYVVRYQPLTWLTWSIVFELFQLRPVGYHLASLLFHCLNTALVFLLIRRLLLLAQPGETNGAKRPHLLVSAGLGALLWAVHPLRVEVVAWASAFLHCQALFFLLVAALCYLEAGTRLDSSRRLYYWASVASFMLSLLSYPIGLGFVVVIMVLDFYPLKRFAGSFWSGAAWRIWREKLPFVGAAGLVLGFTLLLRFNTSATWQRPVSLADFGVVDRVMQACYVWAYYLWKPWVPFNLSPIYMTLGSFMPWSLPFVSSLGLILALSVVLAWNRERWPGAAGLWVCHLAWLVPVLGLTEHPHCANDRYGLVVGLFWSILGAAMLVKLCDRRGAFLAGVMGTILLVGFLGSLSVRQIGIWNNSVSLFQYILTRLGDDPYRSVIYVRLGIAQTKAGHPLEAAAAFNEAVRIDPNNRIAHFNLGEIYSSRGNWAEAKKHYSRAVELAPDDVDALNNLGIVLAAMKDLPGAADCFSQAVRTHPQSLNSNYNLGLTLQKLGKSEEGRVYLERADQLRRGSASSAAPLSPGH
jgi:hypothetical protein